MIKIKVGTGKKSGKKFQAIVYVNKDNEEFYLSFDFITLVKISGMSYNELQALEVGYYDIKE